MHSSTRPLKVIIVGAGIGGLTAAVALRRQGHLVDVYESSAFSKELGVALHIAPNSHGILKRLGLSIIETGAVQPKYFTEYSQDGQKQSEDNLELPNKLWQHEWLLAHRAKLHDALKTAATAVDGTGVPVNLHLAQPVVDVESTSATIYFRDGSKATGDVVVGADGVHSITRARVPGADKKPFPSGQSSFRFLISRKDLLDDPATKKFAEKDGQMLGIFGRNRRIVVYPTSNNEWINVSGLHPSEETSANEGWGSPVSKAKLLEIYKDFHPDILAFLDKAKDESLKVWKLLDMEVIPRWTSDKLALLGDAAHPFLPYQGQGASCAIEDAAALATVLEQGTCPEEISERLALYQNIRKKRADYLQDQSRQSGKTGSFSSNMSAKDLEAKRGAGSGHFNVQMAYNFGHDEFDNSAQQLREWKWSRQSRPLQTVFGPAPVPARTTSALLEYGFTSISILMKTSRTTLQELIPIDQNWKFCQPGTFAFCTLIATINRQEQTGYTRSQFGLCINGLELVGEGQPSTNAFIPIVFEDGDTISPQNETTSRIPKALSSTTLEESNGSIVVRTVHNGKPWSTIELRDLRQVGAVTNGISIQDHAAAKGVDRNLLIHNYQPNIVRSSYGQVSLHTVDSVPLDELSPSVKAQAFLRTSNVHVDFRGGDHAEHTPIHHIVERFAEIPIYAIEHAQIVRGQGFVDVVDAMVLSRTLSAIAG